MKTKIAVSFTGLITLSLAAVQANAALAPLTQVTQASPASIDQVRKKLISYSQRDLTRLIADVRLGMGSSAYEPLLKIATSRDETERNRYMAISILSEIDGKRAIPVLTRLTLDPSIMTKLSSIRSLEKLDPKAAERAATRFRKDATLIVRLEGLRVLRQLKTPIAE